VIPREKKRDDTALLLSWLAWEMFLGDDDAVRDEAGKPEKSRPRARSSEDGED
jgi:hypothetical protein